MTALDRLIERFLVSETIALDAKLVVYCDGHLELTSQGAKLIDYVIARSEMRGIDVTDARALLIQAQTDAALRELAG
jgi:hypothetical protein